MKVVYLGPGTSIHSIRWANALALVGMEVHLVTLHAVRERHDLDSRVRLHTLPFGPPQGYFFNWISLRSLLTRIRPDVLHVNVANGYGTLARLANAHPYLLSVWGSDVLVFPHRGWWAKELVKRNLKSADFVASTSHAMADAVSRLGRRGGTISITPFGVDCDVFAPRNEQREKRDDTFVVGVLKTLDRIYGIDTAIRAFSRLGSLVQRTAKLVIVGSGRERAALLRLARELHVSGSVEFIPAVPHALVPSRLSEFSVYLNLSRSESFGTSVLEASACGIPVIATIVGGLPEVVVDQVTGILVPPDDEAAVTRALETLALDPSLRKQMGSAGRDFVRSRYDWRESVATMVALYEQVSRAGPPSLQSQPAA